MKNARVPLDVSGMVKRAQGFGIHTIDGIETNVVVLRVPSQPNYERITVVKALAAREGHRFHRSRYALPVGMDHV